MEEPRLYAVLPGICEKLLLHGVRIFAELLLDYANLTIVLEDLFRARRTGYIGLLGTAYLKIPVIAHVVFFLKHKSCWNMVTEAFMGSQDTAAPILTSPAIVSSRSLQVIVAVVLWTSIALAESIWWCQARTLTRWLRAPLLLLFHNPPRVVWFLYGGLTNTAFQKFTTPVSRGGFKGAIPLLPLLRPVSGRMAAFLCALGPWRREQHSRAALSRDGVAREPYSYSPLGDRQIRLLRLTADVNAELVTVHVDQAPVYVAVSYRWKPGAKEFSLNLQHGQSIPIPPSVYRILQSLTPVRGSIDLWIDSICIDQASRAEKEAQIPLMGDIYRRAARVVACFPDIAHYEFLANDLQQLNAIFAATGDRVLLQQGKRLLSRTDRWNAVKALIQDDFWGRLWIIQEVVLAKELFVLAGGCLMEWSLIIKFAKHQSRDAWRKWDSADGDDFEQIALFGTLWGTEQICKLDQLRCKVEQLSPNGSRLGPFRPWDVLPLTQLSQATIGHDKLYGVLGLCKEAYGVAIRADYDVPAYQTFKGASRMALADGSLKLLQFAGLALRGSAEAARYPSWSFDLDHEKAQLQAVLPFYANLDSFGVASSTSVRYEPPKASDGDAVLRLRGNLIDTITACDSGRTWEEGGIRGHSSMDKFDRYVVDLSAEEEAVIAAIPDLDKCLRHYRRSLHHFRFQLALMLRAAPDGYMAKVPGIVAQHIPETYLGTMTRDEAYWRTVLTKQASEDVTSQLDVIDQACKVGDWQRRTRLLYAQLASVEEKALLVKSILFMDCLTPADTVAITESPSIARFAEDAKEMHNIQTLTGTNEFLSAYYASQTAHQVVATEKGFLALAPWGTRVGDVVVVFDGANVPSILRHREDGGDGFVLWTGASYVCGLMEEDALRGIGEERWFELR